MREEFSFLKYSIFFLNQDEIVLRLHNLAEHEDIKIMKHSAHQFEIAELGLSLKFVDIKESFANGNWLKERNKWTDEQLRFKPGAKDTTDSLILEPL